MIYHTIVREHYEHEIFSEKEQLYEEFNRYITNVYLHFYDLVKKQTINIETYTYYNQSQFSSKLTCCMITSHSLGEVNTNMILYIPTLTF